MKAKRIFIVRHGQSAANVDKQVYTHTPDYAVRLTEVGKRQAFEVGEKIKGIIGDETVQFYVSPFYRTRETAIEMRKSILAHGFREDVRLREQEWQTRFMAEQGFHQQVHEERAAYGYYYYRFNGGESPADCYDRLSGFLDTLHRDMEKEDFPENVIIVSHGIAMRVFLQRWFHLSVESFEELKTPKNCEFYLLEIQENNKYKLATEPEKYEHHAPAFSF
jgi:broad specificity phosphatase PhoE